MEETTKRKVNPMVEKLLDLNQKHAGKFINSKHSRQIYRVAHPTEISVMKCMDGRVHLPVMTNTPLGIIQPWRNIGGKFNLGWPHFKETIKEWTDYTVSRGRSSVVFTTYHYAAGFEGEDQEVVKNRGCAGHNYDTKKAIEESYRLKQQFDRVYSNDTLYAIHCGVETDLDALVLHGDNGEILDLAKANFSGTSEVVEALTKMYPRIPLNVINDILPLVEGNIAHVAEIKRSNRPKADSEHRERVLAIGRGFDWLHEPNLALIMGPYDPDLKTNIIKAAGILQSNIDAKRIDPSEGLVLLVSATYRNLGSDQNLAKEKAAWIEQYAYSIIKDHVPASDKGTQLVDHLAVVSAVCDMTSRKLTLL